MDSDLHDVRSNFKDWTQPDISKDGYSIYGWRCLHPERLTLGQYVDLAHGVFINAAFGVVIGERSELGPFCSVLTDNSENDTRGPISIGEHCLIGAYCLILPNSVIPDGTKIPAYSIWRGDSRIKYNANIHIPTATRIK